MSWKPLSLVDGSTNTLWSPIKAREEAPEKQGTTRASTTFNEPQFTRPIPLVTKVVAHDPVQKFFKTTRFVPIRSLAIYQPNLSIDPNTARRYSIIANQKRRFSLIAGSRRYRLVVEGTSI